MTFKRPSSSRPGGLFGDAEPERKPLPAHQANVDGGSRGNPGPAAYGVVIRDGKGEIVARLKKYIGQNTNNVAEYFGLIAALDYAQNHSIRALRVESDSELLVKQMRGQYKVKSEDLRPLFERAKKMSQSFEYFRIDHVYREQNRDADALVNQALDETSRGSSNLNSSSAIAPAKQAAKDPTMRVVARYKDGQLQPYEPLDLPEGTEVEILLRLRK
ncbi:MAG TPA: reverse transcriptase-like protein [Candidatus Acidoferrum sp.]